MRNMSFSMTTEAFRRREKTVTRRLGWWFLKPGDLLQGVEKCQGLKKGEHVVGMHVIRVLGCAGEHLDLISDYGPDELDREGFPGQTAEEFIDLFMRHNGVGRDATVNRIVFEYVEEPNA